MTTAAKPFIPPLNLMSPEKPLLLLAPPISETDHMPVPESRTIRNEQSGIKLVDQDIKTLFEHQEALSNSGGDAGGMSNWQPVAPTAVLDQPDSAIAEDEVTQLQQDDNSTSGTVTPIPEDEEAAKQNDVAITETTEEAKNSEANVVIEDRPELGDGEVFKYKNETQLLDWENGKHKPPVHLNEKHNLGFGNIKTMPIKLWGSEAYAEGKGSAWNAGTEGELDGPGAEWNIDAVKYNYTFLQSEASISPGALSAEASATLVDASAAAFHADGTLAGNHDTLKGSVDVGSAEATAEVKAAVNFKEGEAALSGTLGGELALIKAEASGEVCITPKRIWDVATWTAQNGILPISSTVGKNGSTLGSLHVHDERSDDMGACEKLIYDAEICVKVTGKASAGSLAAEAEASAEYKDGKLSGKLGAGAAFGVGGKAAGGGSLDGLGTAFECLSDLTTGFLN